LHHARQPLRRLWRIDGLNRSRMTNPGAHEGEQRELNAARLRNSIVGQMKKPKAIDDNLRELQEVRARISRAECAAAQRDNINEKSKDDNRDDGRKQPHPRRTILTP
jgi:hypothetical protein